MTTEPYPLDDVEFWQAATPENTAHVIIDVQSQFCQKANKDHPCLLTFGSEHTEAVTLNIVNAKSRLTPLCNKTFIVYFDSEDHGLEKAFGGLYLITQDRNDISIRKDDDDVFESDVPSGIFETTLNANGITHLLVSGFNASACVNDSVESAIRKNYKTALMVDCVGEDDYDHLYIDEYFASMSTSGAYMTNVDRASKRLEANVQKRHETSQAVPLVKYG